MIHHLSNSLYIFGIALLFAAPDSKLKCKKAINYKTDDFAVAQMINLCFQDSIPVNYETNLNIPVCDDKLCAPLFLKIRWDLAGNYLQFDTISGHPLTKFDHKPFSGADYKKLDLILKNKNSILQGLAKNDLIDRNIELKATTVDAVTGATPATIKTAVVEGAVYSSYTLWHLVNGPIGDSLRAFTLKNFSEEIVFKLLNSDNFETQLFAIKHIIPEEYNLQFEKLLPVLEKSPPIVRSGIIGKLPLPFQDTNRNKRLVQVISTLDDYSKSIFINKIISGKETAAELGMFVLSRLSSFNEKQQNEFVSGVQKLKIQKLDNEIAKATNRK